MAMDRFLATVDRLADASDPFLLTADIDSFSKISTESRQLIEIIDIRDELDIVKSVLAAQKKVLKQLREIIRSQGRNLTSGSHGVKNPSSVNVDVDSGRASGDTAFKSVGVVDDAIRIVEDNLNRVEEMDNSATRVHTEVSIIEMGLLRKQDEIEVLTHMPAQTTSRV